MNPYCFFACFCFCGLIVSCYNLYLDDTWYVPKQQFNLLRNEYGDETAYLDKHDFGDNPIFSRKDEKGSGYLKKPEPFKFPPNNGTGGAAAGVSTMITIEKIEEGGIGGPGTPRSESSDQSCYYEHATSRIVCKP